MHKAFTIEECLGRSHPFLNGRAGQSWLDGFKVCQPMPNSAFCKLSYLCAACANKATIVD